MALNDQTSFPLVLLASMSAPLLGAVNTLLYSCGADMRQQIRPSFIWVSAPQNFWLRLDYIYFYIDGRQC